MGVVVVVSRPNSVVLVSPLFFLAASRGMSFFKESDSPHCERITPSSFENPSNAPQLPPRLVPEAAEQILFVFKRLSTNIKTSWLRTPDKPSTAASTPSSASCDERGRNRPPLSAQDTATSVPTPHPSAVPRAEK